MLWRSIFLAATIIYSIEILSADGWFLYPPSTVFQITASFSAPVELPTFIRLFFDWGFQVNYNMPFSLENFYNIPKWPGLSRQQYTRAIDYDKYMVTYEDYTHPSDSTAGEIYTAIENLMISYGYHETCLLKSVCEVAKHPFDLSEENLIAELLHFVLSPSLHKSFGKNETVYREVYEAAEMYGASDLDCDYAYPDCEEALINSITKVQYNLSHIEM